MVGNATHRQIHFGKAESGVIFLLTKHIYSCNVTLFCLYIFCTLDKHTAGTTAGIVECAVERFNEGSNKFHYIVRSVKLAVLFGGVYGKGLQKVFIDTADQILFLTKYLVGNLVYLINNLFKFVGLNLYSSEQSEFYATLKRVSTVFDGLQSIIKRSDKVRSRHID